MTQFMIPRKSVERLALAAHERRYAERGERHADEAEMKMHRNDPCACWDMIYDEVEYALGGTFSHISSNEIFVFDDNFNQDEIEAEVN